MCDRIRCVAGQLRWCGSMAEQLICNQQVDGSTPFTSSKSCNFIMGDFPSGQRGQTVNLLSTTSLVRIQHPPPQTTQCESIEFFVCGGGCTFEPDFFAPQRNLVRSFSLRRSLLASVCRMKKPRHRRESSLACSF